MPLDIMRGLDNFAKSKFFITAQPYFNTKDKDETKKLYLEHAELMKSKREAMLKDVTDYNEKQRSESKEIQDGIKEIQIARQNAKLEEQLLKKEQQKISKERAAVEKEEKRVKSLEQTLVKRQKAKESEEEKVRKRAEQRAINEESKTSKVSSSTSQFWCNALADGRTYNRR